MNDFTQNNPPEDDPMDAELEDVEQTLNRLFQDAFPLDAEFAEETWREFHDHTLPEKAPWIRFSRLLERTERQVRRAMRQAGRRPRRGKASAVCL